MADRVHPLLPSHPSPSAAPSSAAPSNKQQDVVCHVPLTDTEKQNVAPHKVPKDVVYKTPLPLPATHPSKTPRRRRSPCCCCLAWICAVLAAILIVIGIAVLVIYLVVQPTVPKYSIQDGSISEFNVTKQPLQSGTVTNASADASYLNSKVLLVMNARNPNKKIGIYYDDVQVSLSYNGVQIGKSSITPFYQGHKNTTLLQLELQGTDVALSKDVAATLNKALSDKSSISLEAETVAHVRIKIGSLKSSDVKLRVICNVEMSAPTSGSTRVLSKSCSLKM